MNDAERRSIQEAINNLSVAEEIGKRYHHIFLVSGENVSTNKVFMNYIHEIQQVHVNALGQLKAALSETTPKL